MKKQLTGDSLTVPALAAGILLLLSIINWNDLTAGRLSNFKLFEDIFEPVVSTAPAENVSALIDPELENALSEVTNDAELPVHEFSDTHAESSEAVTSAIAITYPTQAPERVNGVLPIEDYSSDGNGLGNFRAAIAARDNRVARVAVIGDSYIEGDIFTQDIRSLLQSEYGGRGVGYMSMHSDFPGFRRSVQQSDEGWTVKDMRKHSSDPVKPISGEYCVANAGATTTFRGSKVKNADSWSSTRLLYIAPADGSITMRTDSGSQTIPVLQSDKVQIAEIINETSKANIRTDIAGLKVLGAWLEDQHGVSVDCMSLRGNSGASHRSLSSNLASEMSQFVNYDLIVVEYGMNALSSAQTDYTSYGLLMKQVIAQIRNCYPAADILLVGVGDRGEKNGSQVTSLSTVEAMISAQRKCAQEAGILFWDTRAAMGGENSIVDWRKNGYVNADYIHLNHKGGAQLAKEFVNSLKLKINE